MFWFNVPLGLAGALWGTLVLRELATRDSERGLDMLGTLTFVAGLTGLVLGISRGGLSGWDDPIVIGGLEPFIHNMHTALAVLALVRIYRAADVEQLREVLRLKRLLGLSLEELRELSAAEAARAARRVDWDSGVEDPLRRRAILEEAGEYVELQLRLLRRRREQLDGLERELVNRRRRLQTRLRALRPTKR